MSRIAYLWSVRIEFDDSSSSHLAADDHLMLRTLSTFSLSLSLSLPPSLSLSLSLFPSGHAPSHTAYSSPSPPTSSMEGRRGGHGPLPEPHTKKRRHGISIFEDSDEGGTLAGPSARAQDKLVRPCCASCVIDLCQVNDASYIPCNAGSRPCSACNIAERPCVSVCRPSACYFKVQTINKRRFLSVSSVA